MNIRSFQTKRNWSIGPVFRTVRSKPNLSPGFLRPIFQNQTNHHQPTIIIQLRPLRFIGFGENGLDEVASYPVLIPRWFWSGLLEEHVDCYNNNSDSVQGSCSNSFIGICNSSNNNLSYLNDNNCSRP